MSDAVLDAASTPTSTPANEPNLGWALAGLSAAAGVIHIAMTPLHAAGGWQDPLGFAAAGWFQLIIAGMILANRATKRTYQVAVVANLVLIGLWAWSRIAGLPWGESPNVAQTAGAIDVVAVLLEVGVVIVGMRLLLARDEKPIGLLAPALLAVAALGLATTVIVSPDAANHGATKVALTGMEALQADVAQNRCDRDMNIGSYWDEARYLGIDTEFGNNPPAVEGDMSAMSAMSSDGHSGGHGSSSSSSATTTTTEPDPTGGHGSVGLDQLVSITGLAATSEGDAARLVTSLSKASDEDYAAWLWWLRSSGSIDRGHSAMVSSEDGSGHGGHVGPQPWEALTDPAECKQLNEEIALARDTALKHPTVADAEAAGYRLVTGFVPGIAAHYIKYSLIDGTFEIDQPEMILYDGDSPDSAVVGLSYYMIHQGDNKPTQGFAGDNDHAHRHIGLCSSKAGVIIGDSQTTAEDCDARGGNKSGGDAGWMSHAWVVPGCESPWGVFSAATPLLDSALGDASTKDGGGCAGSAVRDRYNMDAASAPDAPKTAQAPSDTAGG